MYSSDVNFSCVSPIKKQKPLFGNVGELPRFGTNHKCLSQKASGEYEKKHKDTECSCKCHSLAKRLAAGSHSRVAFSPRNPWTRRFNRCLRNADDGVVAQGEDVVLASSGLSETSPKQTPTKTHKQQRGGFPLGFPLNPQGQRKPEASEPRVSREHERGFRAKCPTLFRHQDG